MQIIEIPHQESIIAPEENENYKQLGILEVVYIKKAKIREKNKKIFLKKSKKISRNQI